MEKNVVSKYSGKGKKVIICTLIIFLIILAFLMGAGLIYAGTIFGLISNNKKVTTVVLKEIVEPASDLTTTKYHYKEISDHGSADLEMIEVPAGKQSADMHIGSYLGYLAGKNEKNCSIVVVSKDSDFDKLISFWVKKTGIAAARTEQIKKRETKKRQQTKQHQVVTGKTCAEENSTKKKLNQEVIQRLRGKRYKDSVVDTVAEIVMRCYGNERMLLQVHNALKDTYSNYLEVYETIKPVLVKCVDAGKRHL